MKLQLGRAISLVMQTMPYIIYRAMVYGAVTLGALVYVGFLALIGFVFGSGAFWLLLILSFGASAVLGLGRLLGEYVLYMLKAGHIALVTELATEGKLPAGVSQTEWARKRVMSYFKEVSVLSLIDQLVKGVINAVNRTLFNVMTILPIPGMENMAQVAQHVVDYSVTYVDESILAYTFKTKNENVYDAAKTGIVLYAQCWKGLLKNAVALTILSYVFVAVASLVFLIPLGALAWVLPASWGTFKFFLVVAAIFLGMSLKWVLFDPIATTATILTFFEESASLEPSREWEERIASASDKFAELKEKAYARFQEMTGGSKRQDSPSEEIPVA